MRPWIHPISELALKRKIKRSRQWKYYFRLLGVALHHGEVKHGVIERPLRDVLRYTDTECQAKDILRQVSDERTILHFESIALRDEVIHAVNLRLEQVRARAERARSPWQLGALVFLGITAICLTIAVLSVSDLLDSRAQYGHLIPGDAPAVVGAIVGIGGALSTLAGAVLNGFARYVQARGQGDKARAQGEADILRAQANLTLKEAEAKAKLVHAEIEMLETRNRLSPGTAPTPATPESTG
jgi:hypothetical protein